MPLCIELIKQLKKKNCTLFLVLPISPVLLVCVNGEKIQLRMSNLIFVNSSSPPLSMDCQVCLCTVLAAVIVKSMDLPKCGCTLGERVGIWGKLYLSLPPLGKRFYLSVYFFSSCFKIRITDWKLYTTK